MLTGRFEAIPGEGERVTPSTWQSMSDSFMASYQTPFLLSPQSTEDRRELLDSVIAMQGAANAGDQGLGQKTATWFAGVAGGMLNPYSLMAGEATGAIASQAIKQGAGIIGKYIPVSGALVASAVASKRLSSFLGENVPNFVGKATVGGIAKGAVTGVSSVTGFSLPQELANTYDPKNDSFNWWGGVKSSFADGGIGLGLMAVPYLAGTLWGKMFKGAVSHTEMPLPHEGKVAEGIEPTHPVLSKINEAEEAGNLSKNDAQWFRDYVTGGDTNENLVNRAMEVLIKDGHPVDAATKRVLLQIFKPEDIDQLQVSLADRLASTSPENMKPLLSKFMIDGKIDEYRGNTKMIDGMQGVVQFINKRLSFLPEEMVNFNKIIRRFLPEQVRAENPLTQNKIYRAVRSGESLSHSVPKQVERRVKQERRIKEFEQRINNYQRELAKTGRKEFESKIKKAQERIDELQKNLEPLLSHEQEIAHLRDQLMPNGKVKENFKTSRPYQRLLDLTRVRNDARHLMHELHVTHEYELHGHYANFLDAMTKVMRSSVGDLADHNNVLDYMKDRLVRSIPDFEKIEEIETRVDKKVERVKQAESAIEGDKVNNEKAFKDDMIKSFDEDMKDAPPEIMEQFDSVKNQFKEFNEQQSVFKNLIKCVRGTLNV